MDTLWDQSLASSLHLIENSLEILLLVSITNIYWTTISIISLHIFYLNIYVTFLYRDKLMHASSKIFLQQVVSNIHYTIKTIFNIRCKRRCFSKLMKSNSLLQQTLSVFQFLSVLKCTFVWLTSSQILYMKKAIFNVLEKCLLCRFQKWY